MNYQIYTPIYEEHGKRRHRYRIMFDKFTITSIRTYATKEIAHRKAKEHLEELRKAFNKKPEMVIHCCG